MDSKRINELLSKYWNCETSLEEEAELREHFKTGYIPDELKETSSVVFNILKRTKKNRSTTFSFDAASDGKNPTHRRTRPDR
jgi:hypothetical protein